MPDHPVRGVLVQQRVAVDADQEFAARGQRRRAAGRRPCPGSVARWITRRRGSRAASASRTAPVSSVLPSLTAMTSSSGSAAPAATARSRGRCGPSLWHGTMMRDQRVLGQRRRLLDGGLAPLAPQVEVEPADHPDEGHHHGVQEHERARGSAHGGPPRGCSWASAPRSGARVSPWLSPRPGASLSVRAGDAGDCRGRTAASAGGADPQRGRAAGVARAVAPLARPVPGGANPARSRAASRSAADRGVTTTSRSPCRRRSSGRPAPARGAPAARARAAAGQPPGRGPGDGAGRGGPAGDEQVAERRQRLVPARGRRSARAAGGAGVLEPDAGGGRRSSSSPGWRSVARRRPPASRARPVAVPGPPQGRRRRPPGGSRRPSASRPAAARRARAPRRPARPPRARPCGAR